MCSEDNPLISRTQSLHRLPEVIVHAEEECSVLLPPGLLDRIELLVQCRSKFFHE